MRRRSGLTSTGVLAALLLAVPACSPTRTEPAYATVTVGPLTYKVEVAQTAKQQREGLGDRSALPDGTGMLFPFGSRKEQQVWMAGTTISLDIAWIVDNTVVATDTLTPCRETNQSECPRWTSPGPVDALLEVPAHSLPPGAPGMNVVVRR